MKGTLSRQEPYKRDLCYGKGPVKETYVMK